MSFFDLIQELRKGIPDLKKAAKAMKILGLICFLVGVWNFAFYFIAPIDDLFTLPPEFPYIFLGGFSILGLLFLYSAYRINQMNPAGKRAGQLAILLLLMMFLGFGFYFLPKDTLPFGNEVFTVIFMIFLGLVSLQFILPAYFGIRYIGRVPVKGSYNKTPYEPDNISRETIARMNQRFSGEQMKYKEALLPFGVIGTFAFEMAVFMISFLLIEKYYGSEISFHFFVPAFLFIFFAPVVYNYFPSSFENKRVSVASYTGGGSVFLFSGSWPFFRLIIYNDGIEIRVMFHRFFVPFNIMGEVPDKVGFFGLLIKTDLPGVPSSIRFHSFGRKKIVETLREIKNKYVAMHVD